MTAIADAVAEIAARADAEREAVEALLELADDLRADAVARLRERGASEAQVERYETALGRRRERARAAWAALSQAIARAQELADV